MKKILVLVPILALMAAGCGSAVTSNSNSQSSPPAQTEQSSGTNSNAVNTPPSMPAATGNNTVSSATTMNGDMWQGTLELSNNGAKGQYMMTTGGHTIYLNTSRDFSSLVGKPVNITYQGTMDSFIIGNITAQ